MIWSCSNISEVCDITLVSAFSEAGNPDSQVAFSLGQGCAVLTGEQLPREKGCTSHPYVVFAICVSSFW